MEDTTDGVVMEQILQGLAKGTVLYKIRSLNNSFRKKYFIDLQTMRLKYSPSKKRLFCNTLPHVDLHEIEEVRKGWRTDVFHIAESRHKRRVHLKTQPTLQENCCFSVILGPTSETIDLLAPNPETRDAWCRGLTHLVASCKNAHREQQHERWLKMQFRKADKLKNGSLTLSDCTDLLFNMNIEMDKIHVEALFKAANFRKVKRDGEEALDLDEFVIFYRSIEARPELETVFKLYSVNEALVMGPEELCRFLKEEQKMILATVQSCRSFIDRFEKDHAQLAGFLSFRGFKEMMLSKDHDIFNREHRNIYQDMQLPLSNYYISSSHNTYLIEGQLIGYSSIEGYIRVLKAGCRCVELDLWDGPDGEPIIYHGYTLTSKILLKDVLEAIRQYAFVTSQYPVILSLENHCSVEQQKVTALLISSILSDYLYNQPVGKDETQLPSPEALARKILVKAKKMEHDGEDESDDENENELDNAAAEIKRPHITRQISDLVNYCKATSFKTFREARENWKFYEMCSFQEVKADHLSETASEDFIQYNQTNLSRIYPKGTRVESSNMDPTPYWNVGCHMVSLNCQKGDLGMLLQCGQFLPNGQCGYILKPSFLRNGGCNLSEIPSKTKKKILIIKIISGQHIPRPGGSTDGEVVDPYVTVRICGHPVDKQKKRTAYVPNNGFNPKWNETLILPIAVPELALVLFEVKDNCNTGYNLRLAQFALPFTSVADGYRHIHLWDDHFENLPLASLFVHVTIVDDK